MKYCPNPECPYALRHHEGQEYRDEAVTCADCGAELATEPPAWATQAAAAARPRDLPWARLAATVALPLMVVWLAPKIHLPRVDYDRLEWLVGQYLGELSLSVFALQLSPMLSAFFLVELAALCVPVWRSLRTGGPAGRARLAGAAGWLTLGLALFQALGMALHMEKMEILEPDVKLSRLVVVFTLVAGTFLLWGITLLLDRVALGGGVSVLATAIALASWRAPAEKLWSRLAGPLGLSDPSTLLSVGAVLLAVAGTVFVLRRRQPGGIGQPPGLPLPASGIVPLACVAWAVWSLVQARGGFASQSMHALVGDRPGAAALVSQLAVVALLAVSLGFLFNRPSKVAAFGPDAGRRVSRAVAFSTAYLIGLAVLGWVLARELGLAFVSLVPLAAAVAVVLDVVAEARALQRHGPQVPVWPEHRLYAVGGALAALEARGIPGFARSVNQRVLWHFFAPFIPVQIMVPPDRAEMAAQVLADRFGPPPGPAAGSQRASDRQE